MTTIYGEIDRLPAEIIYQILLPLSYEDTVSYCSVSKSAYIICNDSWFWIRKVDYELQYENCNKPSDYIMRHGHENGIDIYRRWTHREGFYDEITNKHNDIVFWMMDRYPQYMTQASKINQYTKMYQDAAAVNNEEILLWLDSQGIVPDINAPNSAAENGHLNVLRHLELKGILPNVYGANSAAQNGYLDIIQYLELKGILPDAYGATYALSSGHMDVVHYLEQKNIIADTYIYPIHCNKSRGENAILYGLKEAIRRGLHIDSYASSGAASDGYLEILKLLQSIGIRPYSESSDNAIINNHLDVLIWLDKERISPSTHGIDAAFVNGNSEILAYLSHRRKLHANRESINLAIIYGKLNRV